MSAKKQKPTIDELEKILNSEEKLDIVVQPDGSITAEKPNVKAKVVSHSRDYLTLEFIGNEPKAFAAGEVVEISKA